MEPNYPRRLYGRTPRGFVGDVQSKDLATCGPEITQLGGNARGVVNSRTQRL